MILNFMIFFVGACVATNFAATAWRFPNISRWFYLYDAIAAAIMLGLVVAVS